MKQSMLKTIMWVISLVPTLLTAVIFRSLPDQMPMHFDIHGEVDRWGSRYELFVVCALFLFITFFMWITIRNFEKKAEETEDEKAKAGYLANAKVAVRTGIITSIVTTVIYICIISSGIKMAVENTQEMPADPTRISVIFMGLLFIVMGNYIPKTRRNAVIGLRCSWTQFNDNTWRKGNAFGGMLMVIAGVVTILLGAVMADPLLAMMIMMILLCAVTTASLIYAHMVYEEEKNNPKMTEGDE